MTMDLVNFIERKRGHSRAAYGEQSTLGVIDHCAKELDELRAAPNDLEEWVDLILLALDGAWRTGADPETICLGLEVKLARNEARQWPRPASRDLAVEHDRHAETQNWDEKLMRVLERARRAGEDATVIRIDDEKGLSK